jgi:hypothetical protein
MRPATGLRCNGCRSCASPGIRKREGGDQMQNAKTDEKREELIEDEVALQRWTWEGGSPWDRFGVMDKIETQLERRDARSTSAIARNDRGRTVTPRASS